MWGFTSQRISFQSSSLKATLRSWDGKQKLFNTLLVRFYWNYFIYEWKPQTAAERICSFTCTVFTLWVSYTFSAAAAISTAFADSTAPLGWTIRACRQNTLIPSSLSAACTHSWSNMSWMQHKTCILSDSDWGCQQSGWCLPCLRIVNDNRGLCIFTAILMVWTFITRSWSF